MSDVSRSIRPRDPRRLGESAIRRRARRIRVVLMDCDGVMTDGRVIYSSGAGEIKAFNARDGVGMRLAQGLGLEVGIVTGRRSEAVARRARELGLREVHQKVWDKRARVEELLRRRRASYAQLCFIGDDIIDLPVLRRAGLAVAPADAHAEVRRRVHWVTRQPGGGGAVREVLDLVLDSQGLTARLMEPYLS
jgi:3-deoxy-D-manno-octulosonate 8-phosphate phosphatase (KDO 8-P phosphatase)